MRPTIATGNAFLVLLVSCSGQGCKQEPDDQPTVTVGTVAGSPDSDLDFDIELDGFQFIVTVKNISDHPVTISRSDAPIWLLFDETGPTAQPEPWTSTSRSQAAKPAIRMGRATELFWLFEGETHTYRTGYVLEKNWSNWKVRHTNHHEWDAPPNVQELTEETVRITPRYFEVRLRREKSFNDPFDTKERGYGKEHILHLPK